MYKKSFTKGVESFVLSNEDLTTRKLLEIKNCIKENKSLYRIGFDLSALKCIDNKFLLFLYNLSKYIDVSVYNLSPLARVPFFVMKCNKSLSLYLNENDFILNKNLLVRRRLKVCS